MLGGEDITNHLSAMLSRALPGTLRSVRLKTGATADELPDFRMIYENLVDVYALESFPVVQIELLQTEGEISNRLVQNDVISSLWGLTYEVTLHVLCTDSDEGRAALQAKRLLLAVRLAALRNVGLHDDAESGESITLVPETMQESYYELLQNTRTNGYLAGGTFRIKLRAHELADLLDEGEVLHSVSISTRVSKVPRSAALDVDLPADQLGRIVRVAPPNESD